MPSPASIPTRILPSSHCVTLHAYHLLPVNRKPLGTVSNKPLCLGKQSQHSICHYGGYFPTKFIRDINSYSVLVQECYQGSDSLPPCKILMIILNS